MGRSRLLLERLRREESGFTLIEMVTVLGMLLIVMTCLSYAMIAAHKAEEDMNRRFASQINARIALDQLRREIHCAATVTGGSDEIEIVLGSRCPTAASGGTVRWCAEGSGTRWALYRNVGSTCTTSGSKRVDYLTTNALFGVSAATSASLAFVSVDLPVNAKPGGAPTYRLTDDIVLRNSIRT
jgi:prepilin-type N-terminal cleavage/methylation domain-containing protein